MKTYDTAQKWVKVSNDQTKDWPHKGPYRDNDEQIMHGVYEVKQQGMMKKKYFINNGHKMSVYEYPDIERSFSSPMVNDYNLHLCGGWAWKDIDLTQEIIDRVITGLKPVGFTYTTGKRGKEWLLEQEGIAQQAGCLTYIFNEDKCLGIAYPHKCCEIFDLDALESDYMKYAEVLGGDHRFDDVEEALDILSFYNFIDFFEEFAAGDPTLDREFIIAGLLLGYPIESTVSIIDW